MEFQPSFSSSYFNCANALRLLHDLDRANTHYDKAIKLDPDRGEYVHNQGLVYQEQGRNAEALERFREAVKLAPREIRSEEHTSELQSLMRISYAVFCLKTKKQARIQYTQFYSR